MFGIGYSKFAPGTVASFITCLIFYILFSIGYFEVKPLSFIYFVIFIFFLGIILINKSDSFFQKKDADEIVIDEFVGQGFTLSSLFFVSLSKFNFFIFIIISFILFRFFDIVKPYPINVIDKKMKNSLGVMLDDLVAAIYSIIVIYVIYYLWI